MALNPPQWSGPSHHLGSENAYRHWYAEWYAELHEGETRWLHPYILTAADQATLDTRGVAFLTDVGATPAITVHSPRGQDAAATVLFFDAPLELGGKHYPGLIDNSMPLPRPVSEAKEHIEPSFPQAEKIERIVAVIDADIAFANARFCRGKETAIAWFWDQDADAYDSAASFGRQMDAREIDAYRNRHVGTPGGDAALYREYREDSYTYPDLVALPRRHAHGTGVLDTAVGGDVLEEDDGLAIFAVQLPRFAVGQTQGHFLEVYIRLALDRISTLARRIGEARKDGKPPETFVNISVGGHAGRHDGHSRLERQMDAMVSSGTDPVRGIFLPAGNSRTSRTHARFSGSDCEGDGARLTWRILPDDGTPSFVEIWLPTAPAQGAGVGLTLQPPGRSPHHWDAADFSTDTHYDLRDGTDLLARVYVTDDPMQKVEGVRTRRRVLVAVQHTSAWEKSPRSRKPGRPDLAGDWLLTLRSAGIDPGALVTLWIARDEQIFGSHTGGRQSFFAAAPDATSPAWSYRDRLEREEAVVSGVVLDGTLSDLAAGKATIVVGAAFGTTLRPTDYSSEGILAADAVAGRDIVPTISAVADTSRAVFGISTAGYLSGSRVHSSGTSIAAPQALRAVLQARLAGDMSSDLRAILEGQIDRPTVSNSPKLKRRAGMGVLRPNLPHPRPR